VRPKAYLVCLTVLGVATAGRAQTEVTVQFPDAGEREVWIQTGIPTSAPTGSLRTGEASVQVPTAGKKPTDTVFVWDKKTGNLATRSFKQVQADGSWTVAADAYKDLAVVKVRVEHSGQPVSAADVTLDDGRKPQNSLIDPSAKGEVQFFDVKPGSLKVTAKYKANSGETKSVTQLLDAPLTHSDVIPSLTISIADDVATAAAATGTAGSPAPAPTDAASTAPKTATKPAENGGNTIGSIITYLVGLVFALGVGYFLYKYATQNKDLVESKLKQMGVDIPQPGDDLGPAPGPLAPVAPAKPEPPQKIILDDAAPEPYSPYVASTPISAAVVTGEPKLYSDAGDAMPLPEGETVVGRDVGLGLSLVGESTVSRRHATLVRSGGQVTLNDQGSTNGSFVNGVQVQGSRVLNTGDSVQFGAVKFRYEG